MGYLRSLQRKDQKVQRQGRNDFKVTQGLGYLLKSHKGDLFQWFRVKYIHSSIFHSIYKINH